MNKQAEQRRVEKCARKNDNFVAIREAKNMDTVEGWSAYLSGDNRAVESGKQEASAERQQAGAVLHNDPEYLKTCLDAQKADFDTLYHDYEIFRDASFDKDKQVATLRADKQALEAEVALLRRNYDNYEALIKNQLAAALYIKPDAKHTSRQLIHAVRVLANTNLLTAQEWLENDLASQ